MAHLALHTHRVPRWLSEQGRRSLAVDLGVRHQSTRFACRVQPSKGAGRHGARASRLAAPKRGGAGHVRNRRSKRPTIGVLGLVPLGRLRVSFHRCGLRWRPQAFRVGTKSWSGCGRCTGFVRLRVMRPRDENTGGSRPSTARAVTTQPDLNQARAPRRHSSLHL
jgi:hypothetical protein